MRRALRRHLVGSLHRRPGRLEDGRALPELIRGLVLAGSTLDPDARTMPALLRRAIRTLPHEVLAELPAVIPSYIASGGRPLLRLIRSAMVDRPEDQVHQLTMPSVVITGQHDGFAPPAWARHLAELASAPYVILPGAHNGCFPTPKPLTRHCGALPSDCTKTTGSIASGPKDASPQPPRVEA